MNTRPDQQLPSINESIQSVFSKKEKKNAVIFTACSVNYLDKAMAMCQSALDHHPDIDMVVLIVDRKRPITLLDSRVCFLWAEEIGFPDYLQCAFKYNIIELNTALKPFVASMLLECYKKVIYLDPDVCVFSRLASVFSALDQHSSVFTPHALSPFLGSARPSDRDLLRFGCFNLGFFAVSDTPDARKLLGWWHRQCLENCFYEPQAGLGVDQKWIDLAPAFFDGVHILKDVGLNVAFWNLHERRLLKCPTGWVVNDLFPLGFVHFSSFIESDETTIAEKQTRYAAGSRPDFSEVGNIYRKYLESAKKSIYVANLDYGYSKFDNDAIISPSLRRFYAVSKDGLIKNCIDPFLSTGSVYAFAKRNKLLSSRPAIVGQPIFKAQSDYSKEQKVISIAFRLALRVLGADRYFIFLRYLGHYSSILNQTDLLTEKK